MATLQNVKTILGIKDTLQDDVISLIITNIESRLTVWLKQHAKLDSIPLELLFIVEEMAVARFQRLGSEGMASESVEGHSITFSEDDFAAYMSILETYIPVISTEKPGKVMFF